MKLNRMKINPRHKSRHNLELSIVMLYSSTSKLLRKIPAETETLDFIFTELQPLIDLKEKYLSLKSM